MSMYQASSRVELTQMPQLVEAEGQQDNWTGITDAGTRQKIQNRLNVRAHRRRKALARQAHTDPDAPVSEREVVYWDEGRQTVSLLPASTARVLHRSYMPLIPNQSSTHPASTSLNPTAKIMFPLSSDHLITLLQYNVVRAILANRQIISHIMPTRQQECESAALHVLPQQPIPGSMPQSLIPTHLQCTVLHEDWIDTVPHPGWRDNLIRAVGTFDEDQLWTDTLGGLFEGFPASEVEQRGLIAWSPPWDVSGWEMSEGFWRRWGWLMEGCDDILAATNKWRRQRGEEALC